MDDILRAPYPYFGGKSKIAPLVWRRFGTVRNFVEPFFGSGAVLLGRPDWPFAGDEHRIETVNDLDCHIPNFWRAIQNEPDAVAEVADYPVHEVELHSWHLWLVEPNRRKEFHDRILADPDYYDVLRAGRWVNGICQWIGSGWCEHREWQQLPHLGDAGRGVHRPSQQLPHLGNAGRGEEERDLYPYFRALSERLRGVRVCCGDWSRVCGPTPTVKQGLTAVFLDPPYSHAERDSELYAIERDCSAEVRDWCRKNGKDRRLRIALCGYAGEGHEELEAHGWIVEQWKARGGYGSQGEGTEARENSARERIWFSPHCLREATLFDAEAT